MTTIGADKDGAYSTCEVIPEADVKAKSAYIAKEDALFILPKLQNRRDPAVGDEHPITRDAHFTKHTLSSFALSLDWTKDPSSAEVFRSSHTWEPPVGKTGESRQGPMNGSICLTWEQRDVSFVCNALPCFQRIWDAAGNARSHIGMSWTKSENRQCKWTTEMICSTERNVHQSMRS